MTNPKPREIVVATSNPGKLREIQSILSGAPVQLRGLEGFAPVAFPEEGDDYAENARGKARAAAEATGLPALADDSGLEVDALDGAPGPRSARYGGPGLDDEGRVRLLLEALRDIPGQDRGARFVCVAAWVTPDGREEVVRGECRGWILPAVQGHDGFGYDPVFRAEGESLSMAELAAREKDRISHRGHAFRSLANRLDGTLRG